MTSTPARGQPANLQDPPVPTPGAAPGLSPRIGQPATPGRPRYLHLWQEVARLRAQVADLQASRQYIVGQFRTKIQPLEESLTRQLHDLTARLIERRLAEPTLSTEQVSLMGLWVIDNLQTLQAHPFTGALDVNELVSDWLDSLAQGTADTDRYLMSLSASRLSSPSASGPSGSNQGASPETDDEPGQPDQEVADDHAGSAYAAASGQAGNNPQDQSEPSRNRSPGSGRTAASNDQARLAVLDERLAIEPLFRRLASALHPDREPDEHKRVTRQALMAQCIKAREEADLATLLSLHDEHVGALDGHPSPGDECGLEHLLEQQLQALQHQLRNLGQGSALRTQIHERYHAGDPEETRRRIHQHRDSLQQAIDWLQQQRQDLDSPLGLLRQLRERKEQAWDDWTINELTGA